MTKALRVLLLLALVLTACTQTPEPVMPMPEEPMSATPVSKPMGPSPTADTALSARAADSAATTAADLDRAKSAAAAEPTAARYSDLSYLYLQAARYQEARAAADQALKLQDDHPFALYNRGAAALALGDACPASADLKRAASLQGNRAEPWLALGKAYKALGSYPLAAHAAAQAATAGGATAGGAVAGGAAAGGAAAGGAAAGGAAAGGAAATGLSAAVAAMRTGVSPADLEPGSAARLEHGRVQLYLYPEPGSECNQTKPYTLYIRETGTNRVAKLPVRIAANAPKLLPAVPPGAADQSPGRYWIKGGDVGAGIAGTAAWHLISWQDGQASLVIFTGSSDQYTGAFADFMRSPFPPEITEATVSTHYRDDVTGTHVVYQQWHLTGGGIARLADEYQTLEGEIVAAPAAELHIKSPRTEYVFTYPYASAARVTGADGQPLRNADLKPGQGVSVEIRDGHITAATVYY